MSSSTTRAADAYEKLVEKLLASRRTTASGGRGCWLDAARYADSDGYEKDKSRQVWAYREWVINAFNARHAVRPVRDRADRRRSSSERDAGPDRRHRVPPHVDAQRGGRASTPSSSAWTRCSTGWTRSARRSSGCSVACAQCHDHKFDPISQEEYYQLFAYLNNDYEAERVVYTSAEQMTINGLREQMRDDRGRR